MGGAGRRCWASGEGESPARPGLLQTGGPSRGSAVRDGPRSPSRKPRLRATAGLASHRRLPAPLIYEEFRFPRAGLALPSARLPASSEHRRRPTELRRRAHPGTPSSGPAYGSQPCFRGREEAVPTFTGKRAHQRAPFPKWLLEIGREDLIIAAYCLANDFPGCRTVRNNWIETSKYKN